MTAMSDCREAFVGTSRSINSPSSRSVLNRHVLSAGAAQRRTRAQEIEAEMDIACERAAVGSGLNGGSRDRWSKQAWDRYVVEAVNQSRSRGDELHALWRDAAHLDRLAGAL